ncbi:MAG TPA: hypothetical protein VIV09_17035 [Pseudolabrys sp.]
MSVFQSAIRGEDGEVDAGYLAIAVAGILILGAIPVMCLGSFGQMWFSPDHHFPVQELGIGVGSVCGGFGAVCGAVGMFRMGDKK